MSEVYWAVYRQKEGIAQLVGLERVDKITDVLINPEVMHGAGHGWTVAAGSWRSNRSITVDEALLPDAVSLITLAKQAIRNQRTVSADAIQINYLRNNVAEKSKKACP